MTESYLNSWQEKEKRICLYSFLVYGMKYCYGCRYSYIFKDKNNHKRLTMTCSKTNKKWVDNRKGDLFHTVGNPCFAPHPSYMDYNRWLVGIINHEELKIRRRYNPFPKIRFITSTSKVKLRKIEFQLPSQQKTTMIKSSK